MVPREYPAPRVENLVLSKEEIILGCSLVPAPDKSRSNTSQPVEVLTEAFDVDGDVLTYFYRVSGGKIVGNGAKVTWDLTGVKPGIYKIAVCVDDSVAIVGVGACDTKFSIFVTKEIKVIECPDCKTENE